MLIGSEADLSLELLEVSNSYGELKWSAQLHIAAWLSETGVIQKPDGLESAAARGKTSFSQQMFVCSVSSEAFVSWCEWTLFFLSFHCQKKTVNMNISMNSLVVCIDS